MHEGNDGAVVYDMAVVRGFAISALVWGIVGMAVGLVAAVQLAWPGLNFGPDFCFGRIRPLHTNAVIFAFTLGLVFAGPRDAAAHTRESGARVGLQRRGDPPRDVWSSRAPPRSHRHEPVVAGGHGQRRPPAALAAHAVTSLWIMIPATLLLAGTLVALVVQAARRGEYDDWEGPAARMLHDDDSTPEVEGAGPGPELS